MFYLSIVSLHPGSEHYTPILTDFPGQLLIFQDNLDYFLSVSKTGKRHKNILIVLMRCSCPAYCLQKRTRRASSVLEHQAVGERRSGEGVALSGANHKELVQRGDGESCPC